MKLVFLDSATLFLHHDLSLSRFEDFGEVQAFERTEPQEVGERIAGADLVFTNKVVLTRADLAPCKQLRYIGILATGTNVIEDFADLKRRGVVVTNIPGYSTEAVAQLTFAHILAFANQVAEHDKEVHSGDWQNCLDFAFYRKGIFELAGKTLGIVGYGAIGKKVAQIAQAFSMDCLVYTRTPNQNLAGEHLHFVDFPTLLAASDLVSIHTPLTDKTLHLFDEEAIAQMKPQAYLINTARGPIVDEQAVADALFCGKLAGYAADVVSKEPIEKTNPLLQAKNCHLTPHIAWAGPQSRARLLAIAYENVQAYFSGHAKNQVTG